MKRVTLVANDGEKSIRIAKAVSVSGNQVVIKDLTRGTE